MSASWSQKESTFCGSPVVWTSGQPEIKPRQEACSDTDPFTRDTCSLHEGQQRLSVAAGRLCTTTTENDWPHTSSLSSQQSPPPNKSFGSCITQQYHIPWQDYWELTEGNSKGLPIQFCRRKCGTLSNTCQCDDRSQNQHHLLEIAISVSLLWMTLCSGIWTTTSLDYQQ